MNGKLTLLCLVFLLGLASLLAQKHYQTLSLKTNLLQFWNIGIEVPVKEKYSLEFNTHASWGLMNSNTIHRDKRLHIKYHFSSFHSTDVRNSVYILAGLHSKYMLRDKYSKHESLQETAKFNALRSVLGVGTRVKAFDFWIAAESALAETHNYREFRNTAGELVRFERWKAHGGISAGISWNFLSIKHLPLPELKRLQYPRISL